MWSYAYDAKDKVTDDRRRGFAYGFANQPTAISGDDNGAYVDDGNLKRAKLVVEGRMISSVYYPSGLLVHRDNVTNKHEDGSYLYFGHD